MDSTYATLLGIGVQTLLYLLGGYAMVIRNDARTENLKSQLVGMTEELKELAKVITEQAVQSTRIDNLTTMVTLMQRNLEDMRRGVGWVQSSRREVDGEYDK
jgi:hypothetical protein